MKIKYTFADGEISEVEVNEEVGEFIIESRRQEENYERKERYHAEYSIDQALFEGTDLASDYSVEQEYINAEISRQLSQALHTLTDVQRQRFIMYANGMSLRSIAAAEGVSDHKKISKSIEAAKNKMKKFLK